MFFPCTPLPSIPKMCFNFVWTIVRVLGLSKNVLEKKYFWHERGVSYGRNNLREIWSGDKLKDTDSPSPPPHTQKHQGSSKGVFRVTD